MDNNKLTFVTRASLRHADVRDFDTYQVTDIRIATYLAQAGARVVLISTDGLVPTFVYDNSEGTAERACNNWCSGKVPASVKAVAAQVRDTMRPLDILCIDGGATGYSRAYHAQLVRLYLLAQTALLTGNVAIDCDALGVRYHP